MRPSLRAGWLPWCAVFLLAVLAASVLHAATTHGGAQRDCSACKALNSPGVAHETLRSGRPAERPSTFTAIPEPGPHGASTRLLRPLRAPPGSTLS